MNDNWAVQENVPYIVHESITARMERTNRRLWILCILVFMALLVTNGVWLLYESQYEDQEIMQAVLQDSDDGGTNTYSGNIVGGDLIGETDSSDKSQTQG